ncbi:unnamed protein product [Rotaria sordida]|uniref:Uncharacterized protein n=1 Tax=Rotaria sordida TaxID=392033 RepID=A0A818UT25_9BILA|nr:unnamed protein product [Rotaria sordida]CAF0875139.1 unnamed protein product [Rotaria sordida]CAF3549278.1 unnamed protein product [Rotaria sordida]CAF3702730.1 unnamed protein product [Rotaria sordida]
MNAKFLIFFIVSIALWEITKAHVIKDQELVTVVDQSTPVVVDTLPSSDDTVSSVITTNEEEKLSVQLVEEEKNDTSNIQVDGDDFNRQNNEEYNLTSTVDADKVVSAPLNDNKDVDEIFSTHLNDTKDVDSVKSTMEEDEKETMLEDAQQSCNANEEETTTSTTDRPSQVEDVDEEEQDDVVTNEDDHDNVD